MDYFKQSFAPIEDPDITILILGSIPGDKSLEMNQYYAHPQNRFWKVISVITARDLPADYESKKLMLLACNIGLWDVARSAHRKGSLDSAIENEAPNALNAFIDEHPNLHAIAFNGQKAEAMFRKYFETRAGIRYLSMPSTSPANAKSNFEALCKEWRILVK